MIFKIMGRSVTLREKCPNAEFFGPYFPLFSPNTGKYEPEKTPYLDIFHAVYVVTKLAEIWNIDSITNVTE